MARYRASDAVSGILQVGRNVRLQPLPFLQLGIVRRYNQRTSSILGISPVEVEAKARRNDRRGFEKALRILNLSLRSAHHTIMSSDSSTPSSLGTGSQSDLRTSGRRSGLISQDLHGINVSCLSRSINSRRRTLTKHKLCYYEHACLDLQLFGSS